MMRRPRSAAVLFAVGVLCLFTHEACDKAESPLAPANTVLTVTAVPSQIPISGSGSRITVIGIRPDGNPIFPDTQITLTTNLGVVRPDGVPCSSSAVVDIIEADGQGRAVAQLCGDGRIGEAQVTARLTNTGGGGGGGGGGEGGGGSISGTTATVTVLIGETAESQPSVVMSANPSVVAVGGESVVSLLGRNADGTPVAAGSRIRLAADLGTLRCAGSFGCPGEGTDPCNAVCTDTQGEAEAIFTAGDRSGTGEVTAILGTSDEAMAMIDINTAIETLTLQLAPNTIQRNSDGVEVVMRAFLIDSLGNPLNGVLVIFDPDFGVPDPPTASSNAQGEATSTLTVRDIDVQNVPANGTFEVTARATAEGQTRIDTEEITVLGEP